MSARDPATYRPLSGLAIAGVGLAVLWSVGVGIPAVIALGTGVPLILDLSWLVLPLGAFVLSWAARMQILRSEGTRAGLALTSWGMLLSAVFGLGYASWSLAKEQAVKAEACAFTDHWLDQVQHAPPRTLNSYVAFWTTLEPERRPPDYPLDDPAFEKRLRDRPELRKEVAKYVRERYGYGVGEQQAALPQFTDHDLVRLLVQAGGQAQFSALGVRRWEYRGKAAGGYLVEQTYRITTPEGTFPAVVTVLSSEGGQLPGRQWQVLLDGTSLAPASQDRLTVLGQNVLALRLDSREFARDWVRKLGQGRRDEAYLDTRPAVERPALRNQTLAGCVGSVLGMAACVPGAGPGPVLVGVPPLADAELARMLFLPGFASYLNGDLVADRHLLSDPTHKPAIGAAVRAMFRTPPGTNALPVVVENQYQLASPWLRRKEPSHGADAVVFVQPFRVVLASKHLCEGTIHVASSDPTVLRAVGPDPSSAVALSVAQRPLRWHVIHVELRTSSVLAGGEGAGR